MKTETAPALFTPLADVLDGLGPIMSTGLVYVVAVAALLVLSRIVADYI